MGHFSVLRFLLSSSPASQLRSLQHLGLPVDMCIRGPGDLVLASGVPVELSDMNTQV